MAMLTHDRALLPDEVDRQPVKWLEAARFLAPIIRHVIEIEERKSGHKQRQT